MNFRRKLIALGAALTMCLSGCGGETQVDVERAGDLARAAAASDKFAGVVVSENAVEITRDMDKTIKEVYVEVGDSVRLNEKLFSYDSDALSLTVDKQELEMDKLEQEIKDLKSQISSLESEIKKLTSKSDANTKATKELELRTVNADLAQAEYDKSALQTEINYNRKMVQNADVRSPIKGVVRSINENGDPFIVIQQAGAYQIKGVLNELSLNAGIMEGVGVTILSRTDETRYWTGVVTLVDYNSTSSNEYDSMYGYVTDSGLNTSTSYPFYITLDSTDGLLLGQHVYIQISAAGVQDDLLRIPEGYVTDVSLSPETADTIGKVWGVDPETGNLTQIEVILGEYDPTYGTYVILSGITADDYLADPADPNCKAGAPTFLRNELEYAGETEPTESVPVESGETGETGVSAESGESQDPE